MTLIETIEKYRRRVKESGRGKANEWLYKNTSACYWLAIMDSVSDEGEFISIDRKSLRLAIAV